MISSGRLIKRETAFLLFSDLYFATIKLHTDSTNSFGFAGFLLPARIFEIKEESYLIKRDNSAILML